QDGGTRRVALLEDPGQELFRSLHDPGAFGENTQHGFSVVRLGRPGRFDGKLGKGLVESQCVHGGGRSGLFVSQRPDHSFLPVIAVIWFASQALWEFTRLIACSIRTNCWVSAARRSSRRDSTSEARRLSVAM